MPVSYDYSMQAYWYGIAGYCYRSQPCPEIVGPYLYRALADWRGDNEDFFRASDAMPEPGVRGPGIA